MDDLHDSSDAALVVAIGRWREDALAEAYRRHAGAAYALARRLLNDKELAEEKVKEVVAGLPPDERRAIELAYFGGHTYRQVAIMLEAPEGTVKSRIRSGLRRLRSDLAEAGVGASWAEN